jgi:hypothetical protein
MFRKIGNIQSGGGLTVDIIGNAICDAPQLADWQNSTAPSSTLPIAGYQATISSTGDNTIRYGGNNPLAFTNTTFTQTTGISSPYNGNIYISGLYPDCVYTGNIRGNNNANNNYGNISTDVTFNTTGNLAAPTSIFVNSTSYSFANHSTAKLVGTNKSGDTAGSTISNKVLFINSAITSTNFTNAIHTFSNRGSSNTGLLRIQANVFIVNTGTTANCTIYANGFTSIPTPPTLNANVTPMITITPQAFTDYYSSGITAYKGYYLLANTQGVTLSLTNSNYVSSGDRIYANLTVTQTPSLNSSISSYYFYYDSYTGPPSITSVTINISGPVSNQSMYVSGIYIVYGSGSGILNISANTRTNNIGGNFYNSSQILSYSYTYNNTGGVVNPTSETNLSNSNRLGASFLTNPVDFSSNITIPTITTYSTGGNLSARAYGPNNSPSSSVYSGNINIIMDTPSYNLINSVVYPSSIQSISSTVVGYGFRIPSLIASVIGTNGNVTVLPPSQPWANTQYLRTNPINGSDNYSQDLQLVNGLFVAKGSGYGYMNYFTYYNNTLNYSTISSSGYRYSTFSFQISTTSSLSQYNYIKFIVYGIGNNVTVSSNVPTVGGLPISLLYRIEDTNNYTQFSVDNTPSGYINTTWIDPTSISNNINSSNYSNRTVVLTGGSTSLTPVSILGTTLTINCICGRPINIPTADNVVIYFRIGAPMSQNFYFSYITAQLS